MANQLVSVEAYAQETLGHLNAHLTYGGEAEKDFEGWDSVVPGLRGDSVQYRLSSVFNVRDQLAFDVDTDGDFKERFGVLTINTEKNVVQNITDQEWQTHNLESLMNAFGSDMAASLAGQVDQDLASVACFGGYRWAGNVDANANSLGDFQQLRLANTLFRNFGGSQMAKCVLPDIDTTRIINTGLQEFVPTSNEKLVKNWELGSIRGTVNTKYFQSQLNPIHFSGTLSEDGTGEHVITSITSSTTILPGTSTPIPASIITVENVTNGVTVVDNDLGDIGTATQGGGKFNEQNPLKFLRIQDKTLTANNAQFKVVEGGATAAGGSITFKVIPELVFDGTGQDTARNLNRLISVGAGATTDRLRIVKTHKSGVIWQGKAFRFASPKLPSVEPFPSASIVDKDTKIGYRVYRGAVLGKAKSVVSHDIRYGAVMEPEYAMRLIFPVDGTNFF
jgi:hypothetical protein